MTTLQELIGELITEIFDIDDQSSSKDLYFRNGLKFALDSAEEKLEKEKEQIIKAYNSGNSEKTNWYTVEEYYNDNFK